MAPAPHLLAPRLLGELLGDLGLGALTSKPTAPAQTSQATTAPPASSTNVESPTPTPTPTAPGSPQPTNSQPPAGTQTSTSGAGSTSTPLPTFGSQILQTITGSGGGVIVVTGNGSPSSIGQNAIAVALQTTDAQGHTTYVTQYFSSPDPTGAAGDPGNGNSDGSSNPNGGTNGGGTNGGTKDGGPNSPSSTSPPSSVVGVAVAIVIVIMVIAGVWMFKRWKARKQMDGFVRPGMKARGSIASTILWGATGRDSLHQSTQSSRPPSDASEHYYEDGASVTTATMSDSTVRFPSGREYDLDAPFGSITPPPGELILQPPAVAALSDSSCNTRTSLTHPHSYHTALQSPFADENSSPFDDPFAIGSKRSSAAIGVSPFADPLVVDPHRLSATSSTFRPSCDSDMRGTICSFPSPPTSPPRTGDLPAPSIFSTPYNSEIFSTRRESHSSASGTARESQIPRVL